MRRRAFSLTELLVVLGVLVLLMSLLLPALKRARESAISVQCQSNVRTIMTAMLQYASENNGFLPSCINANQTFNSHTSGYFAYFYQGAGSLNLDFHHGLIMKYLGDLATRARVMRCPNAEGPNYSYVLSFQLGDEFFSHGPTAMAGAQAVYFTHQIVRPAEKILLFEDDLPNDGHFILGMPDDLPSIHHFRHGLSGYGNYGFGDGHVESLSRSDVTANPARTQLTK